MEVEITKYTHGVSIKTHTLRAKTTLLLFSLRVSQWGMVKEPPSWRLVKKITRVFMGANKQRDLFWIAALQLDDLLLFLGHKSIYGDSIKITEAKTPAGLKVKHPRNKVKPPRDYQEPIIDFIVSDGNLKITNLQTGKGKSLIACEAIARLGVRSVLQTKGGYIDKLIPDFEELFDLKKGDLIVAKGGKALIGLINMAKAGDLKAKVIMISNMAIHAFLKEYDECGDDNIFGCAPHELYGILGVGFKVIDEVHEDFHLNFRSNIYCDVPKILALSATLDTDDPFIKSIYDVSLPADLWYSGVKYDAYVDTIALMYQTNGPADSIETKERGGMNYSHGAYENWIMKDKKRLKNYIDMIIWCIDEYHFNADDQEGIKFAVFFRLTEMCEIVAKALRRTYFGVDINVFIADTPEDVLKTSDGIITTIESCGTAKDIRNLKLALLSRNLNKREKNEQVKGRLRRMVDYPEVTPVFIYLNNTLVPKHMEYHENKIRQFEGKVKSHIELRYEEAI